MNAFVELFLPPGALDRPIGPTKNENYIIPEVKLEVAEQRIKQLEAMLERRSTIADEATAIIYGDREKTHGDPARNLEAIAQMWSAILTVPVSPEHVSLMMIALKIVRASNDPTYRDHWTDMVGYALLAERCGYINPAPQKEATA